MHPGGINCAKGSLSGIKKTKPRHKEENSQFESQMYLRFSNPNRTLACDKVTTSLSLPPFPITLSPLPLPIFTLFPPLIHCHT